MVKDSFHVTVNGNVHTQDGPPTHVTLLDWLRSIGLTGAKEGCAEGECGACAVMVARPDTAGTARWTPINACLTPAAAFDAQEVVTAEGLGSGPKPCTPEDLHPVQQQMVERAGSQCGYCTPGFICSMAAEYYRPERRASDTEHSHEHGPNGFDLHALSGNLCRCTGYRPIQDAAYALGSPSQEDPLAQRRDRPAPAVPHTVVQKANSEFRRPSSMDELLNRYAEQPQAVLMAGATDLGVESNIGHARPPLVLAIDHLSALRTLEIGEDHLEIGAALTLSEMERELGHTVPLLAELFPQFASRLIRNSATLGGNLGTASPIGDAAPVLLALDASLVLASVEGERTVALAEYFTGYRQSVRRQAELIRAVRIPRPLATTTAFQKVAKRRFDDISSVAAAIALQLDEQAHITTARIGLGGVAATPIRALAAEQALIGKPWTIHTARDAAEVMATEGTPMDDHRASARYRTAMLQQSLLRLYAQFRGSEHQEVDYEPLR